MATDPMIPVCELLPGDEFRHAESDGVVLRIRGEGINGEPSVVIFYGVDGKWAGGYYDSLTDEMLAEYAAAMPLIFTPTDTEHSTHTEHRTLRRTVMHTSESIVPDVVEVCGEEWAVFCDECGLIDRAATPADAEASAARHIDRFTRGD